MVAWTTAEQPRAITLGVLSITLDQTPKYIKPPAEKLTSPSR